MNESLTGYEETEMKKTNPDYKALYEFKAKRCDNFARRISYIHDVASEGKKVSSQELKKMTYGCFTEGDN